MFDHTTQQYSNHPSILFWFGIVPFTDGSHHVVAQPGDTATPEVSWYPSVAASSEGIFWNDFVPQVNGTRAA